MTDLKSRKLAARSIPGSKLYPNSMVNGFSFYIHTVNTGT